VIKVSELTQKEFRESREPISEEQYLATIEPQFLRESIETPGRLSELYFDPETGLAKPLLVQIWENSRMLWPDVAEKGEVLQAIYVVGSYADATFDDESSDVDLVVRYSGKFQDRNSLRTGLQSKLGQEMDLKFRSRDTPETEKGGLIDLILFNIKPFGPAYDIQAGEWVTFGKTMQDYHLFQWNVFGMRDG
jgi:predicted nucleotidyltransferase|tara:strand:+ start:428 stop:1003 length:576 start_codon:yes stop_codon:yes gene_type:complete